MELPSETGFRGEVAGKSQTAEHQIEIIFRFWSRTTVTSWAVRERIRGRGKFVAERTQDFCLLRGRGVNKSFLEQILCASIYVREAGKEAGFFLRRKPVSYDAIDEFVDAHVLCTGSFRCWNYQLRQGRDRRVLMGGEGCERTRGRKTRMNLT